MGDLIQIIFSGIVTISTVVYAVLTWKLVKETKLIREFQIRPDVRIYFERGEANNMLLYITVENQGLGAAMNVKFEIVKNLEYYSNEYLNITEKGVFKHGIVTFYPNQKHRYFVSALEKSNYDKVIEETLIIKSTYQDITKNKYNIEFYLPVKEIIGIGKSTPPDNYIGRIPFYLEKIDGTLKIISKKVDDINSQNKDT
jgi:hypothetical protein